MTAHVIQPFVTEIYRDLRAGVPIERAVADRATPEAKANFIAAMRADRLKAGEAHRYSCIGQFREMGLPTEWIREAM